MILSFTVASGIVLYTKKTKKKPENTEHSIANTILKLSPTIAHLARPCNIIFDCTDTKSIDCDQQYLELIVLNLVSNAKKSMPRGGDIIIRSIDTERGVELIIEDSGTGMTENVKMRVFEPFFSTEKNSNGIGLTMIKEAVSRVGGKISIASNNQGTKVKIVFKEVMKKVLVIEENGDDFSSIHQMNVLADICKDGKSAMKQLKSRTYDAIILNFGMNGTSIVNDIRANGYETPVVFTSNFLEENVAKKIGTQINVVKKPLCPTKLSALLFWRNIHL